MADMDVANQIATNVSEKLDAQQKSSVDQTTSAVGSLMAAGNRSNTNSDIRNISKTDIKDIVKNSLLNSMETLQSTDQSATLVIGGDITIGCGVSSRLANKLFSMPSDDSGMGTSQGLSVVDISQGSVSAVVASITAKQVVSTIIDNTVKVDASAKQAAEVTQSAGDMTGLVIICAIVALVCGVLAYFKLKGKKGKVGPGMGPGVVMATQVGDGYRSVSKYLHRNPSYFIVFLLMIAIGVKFGKRYL
jgi:hypothetical protein